MPEIIWAWCSMAHERFMSTTFRRILRISFAVIGVIAVLLSVGTAFAVAMVGTPEMWGIAIFGSGLYAAIGLVCLYAAYRLRPGKRAGDHLNE